MANVALIADRDYKKGELIAGRVCPRCKMTGQVWHKGSARCVTCDVLYKIERESMPKKTTKAAARKIKRMIAEKDTLAEIQSSPAYQGIREIRRKAAIDLSGRVSPDAVIATRWKKREDGE